MDQTTHSSIRHKRRNVWIRILVFVGVAALIWLKPGIDALVDGRNQNSEPDVAEKTSDDVAGRPDEESIRPIAPASGHVDLKKASSSEKTTRLGQLEEIRNNVFQSSAGLIYRSGSQDGHRLQHVMQHAKDNSEKKIHGVFDGDGERKGHPECRYVRIVLENDNEVISAYPTISF